MTCQFSGHNQVVHQAERRGQVFRKQNGYGRHERKNTRNSVRRLVGAQTMFRILQAHFLEECLLKLFSLLIWNDVMAARPVGMLSCVP